MSDFTSNSSLVGARTSICPDKVDLGWCAPLLSTGKVGARRSVCPEIVDFGWCAPLLSTGKVGARRSVCPEIVDLGWCALPLGCDVFPGVCWLPITSDRAKVEGARVLTTTEVPRAASGQVGSGSGGVQRFKSSICT